MEIKDEQGHTVRMCQDQAKLTVMIKEGDELEVQSPILPEDKKGVVFTVNKRGKLEIIVNPSIIEKIF